MKSKIYRYNPQYKNGLVLSGKIYKIKISGPIIQLRGFGTFSYSISRSTLSLANHITAPLRSLLK